MKQQQEQEALSGLEYNQILDAWQNHVRVSARAYIHALCDALRRKHPLYSNKDIQKHVIKDVLARNLCVKGTIYESWPEWVVREYKKSGEFSKTPNSEALQTQRVIEEYQIVDKLAEEQEQEEEEEEEDLSGAGPGVVYQPPGPEMPTPINVYETTVTYAEKLWSALVTTNIHSPKKLIPAEVSDPLLDFIKPSRKLWLRTLKGLREEEAGHMIKCLIWLDMLIQDRLKEAKEINKERTEVRK